MDELYINNAIKTFLSEDIGNRDITTEAIFSDDNYGRAVFVAKANFIVAGMGQVAGRVFKTLNPEIEYQVFANDGQYAKKEDILLAVTGPVIDLLKGERVALNLVQRLCGIATLTARFVEEVKSYPVTIIDTRKTTPGLRILEKYAVRVGGGKNHRFNLADGVLIKDNHIAACSGSIRTAVELVRAQVPHMMKIEVEAESLEQVRECLDCKVDVIMLDNMDIPTMKKAVKLVKGKAVIEASGGVSLKNVREIAQTGVNLISIGRLTHSAPACDISMHLSLLSCNCKV